MAVVTQAPNGNVRLSRPLSPTHRGSAGFPGGQAGKNPHAAQERQEAGVRSSGREGPLEQDAAATQCSCLESPMDGGASWATVHGVTESRTRLSDLADADREHSELLRGSYRLNVHVPSDFIC